jgi:hypothetical protein
MESNQNCHQPKNLSSAPCSLSEKVSSKAELGMFFVQIHLESGGGGGDNISQYHINCRRKIFCLLRVHNICSKK